MGVVQQQDDNIQSSSITLSCVMNSQNMTKQWMTAMPSYLISSSKKLTLRD